MSPNTFTITHCGNPLVDKEKKIEEEEKFQFFFGKFFLLSEGTTNPPRLIKKQNGGPSVPATGKINKNNRKYTHVLYWGGVYI
jgi:hypothetical protein